MKLNDLQESMDLLRAYKFKSSWGKEVDLDKFKDCLLDYVQDYWIDGPFPPHIWNVFNRHCDLTNNNQESHNNWFMNLLGKRHANPHTVLGNIVKALTMAETIYLEWKRSVTKKPNRKYKELNDRREAMKTKYEDMDRMEYLKAMGHILVNVHDLVNEISDNNVKAFESMKDTEPAKESDVMEQTIITNDISKAEDPLDHEASEDEGEENPYSGRVIGVHKKTQEKTNNIQETVSKMWKRI